jgi:catechol 2,3-dioxygenase-like lactoylglutathione lyase family enzyme
VAVTRPPRIARISLTTANADELADFYETALGCERTRVDTLSGERFARLVGIEGARARAVVLNMGRQEVELIAFAQPGKPYPFERASNDPWFQHMAIVVTDMRDAYFRLSKSLGWSPITFPAPQRLPAASGGAIAFKFRDPEGHPLELLEFPPGDVPSVWRAPDRAASSIGIDHSAIAIADTGRSVDFYELLGFAVGSRSHNAGIEQARLDGLVKPIVEVTALDLPMADPPHLELLQYHSPRSQPKMKLDSNDVAAARLVLQVDDLPRLARRLIAAGGEITLRGDVAPAGSFSAASVSDPDGHAILLKG